MPNHVTHTLEFYGEKEALDGLFAEIAGHKSPIDFDKLIPQPAILHRTEASSDADIGELLLNGGEAPEWCVGDRRKKCIAAAEVCREAMRETGHRNWYDWCRANWGTKWNAYDVTLKRHGLALGSSTEKATLSFDTAWSVPEPVLAAIAAKYPQIEFSGWATDEGDSYACSIHGVDGDASFTYFEPSNTSEWVAGGKAEAATA